MRPPSPDPHSLAHLSNHDALLIPPRDPGHLRALQVHVLDPTPPLARLPDQVPEIPPRDLGLLPDPDALLPLRAQLPDALLEAGVQVLGRVAEDFAGFGGYAGGVGVGVVERGQGGEDAAGEAGWEGGGDGVQGVGGC